ncbi:MAG: hypothetical protein U0Q22_14245 [Acidimicrobiales bacterium]
MRAAAVVGVLGSSFVVWSASDAAFSGTTTNGTNNWTAGAVAITDDDSGSAMFNVSGLVPGGTGSKCLTVTYGGNVTSNVRLYASSVSTTLAMNTYLNMKIEEGTGGSFASCAGFSATSTLFDNTLSNLTATTYGTGLSSWAPTGAAQAKTYRFTYTLSAATPNSVQGGTSAETFTWEAQSV